MRVTFFHRKPDETTHSIEHLFAAVRAKLPAFVEPRVAVASYLSKGVLPRVYTTVEAAFRQGDVNHITGDVHFLSYLISGRKTVLTIHDCVFLKSATGWRREALQFFWYTLPAARVARITTISEFSKRELLSLLDLPEHKLRVVHDCVDERFQRRPKEFNAARPRILQVGTRSNKNLERVAAALEGIPCVLDIIGALSPSQRAVLARHGIDYTQAENLLMTEVVAKYEACDLLVFASTYEGFGMPIVEANRVGRPVITSNLCSMPEVAGDAALLVDPEDVGSIRSAVKRLISDADLRARLVENGYRNQERFTAERIAQAYADVYRELAPELAPAADPARS